MNLYEITTIHDAEAYNLEIKQAKEQLALNLKNIKQMQSDGFVKDLFGHHIDKAELKKHHKAETASLKDRHLKELKDGKNEESNSEMLETKLKVLNDESEMHKIELNEILAEIKMRDNTLEMLGLSQRKNTGERERD